MARSGWPGCSAVGLCGCRGNPLPRRRGCVRRFDSAAAAPTSPCDMRSCVIAWKFTGQQKLKARVMFSFFNACSEELHFYFISSSSWKRSTLYFVQTSIKRHDTSRRLSMLITLIESVMKNAHHFDKYQGESLEDSKCHQTKLIRRLISQKKKKWIKVQFAETPLLSSGLCFVGNFLYWCHTACSVWPC